MAFHGEGGALLFVVVSKKKQYWFHFWKFSLFVEEEVSGRRAYL